MGRIVALDVGRKRTGIASTDILRIVPGGIGYFPTHQVADWLIDYSKTEPIDLLVIGKPTQSDGSDSESVKYIEPLVNRIKKVLPKLEIVRYDERYTTVLAQRTILDSGVPKMKRRKKGLADEVSAVIILQGFMDSKLYNEKYK